MGSSSDLWFLWRQVSALDFSQGLRAIGLRFMNEEEKRNILYVVAIVLLISWFVGLLTSTMREFIHIFLMIAIIAVFLRVIRELKAFEAKG